MQGQGFDFETILGVLDKISPFSPCWVIYYDVMPSIFENFYQVFLKINQQ